MSEITQRTTEDVEDIATSMGLVCILPRDNEIFLDIDAGGRINEDTIKCLDENGIRVVARKMTVSKSGNQHHYFRFDRKFSYEQRLTVQACMGSDPVKEILSFIRMQEGEITLAASCALFESKFWAKQVNKWRDKFDEIYRKNKEGESGGPNSASVFKYDDDIPY